MYSCSQARKEEGEDGPKSELTATTQACGEEKEEDVKSVLEAADMAFSEIVLDVASTVSGWIRSRRLLFSGRPDGRKNDYIFGMPFYFYVLNAVHPNVFSSLFLKPPPFPYSKICQLIRRCHPYA